MVKVYKVNLHKVFSMNLFRDCVLKNILSQRWVVTADERFFDRKTWHHIPMDRQLPGGD